jgi:hypothetical protein
MINNEDKLKDIVTNVSFNFDFFKKESGKLNLRKFYYKIDQIRSIHRNDASPFYKNITRTINLDNFTNNE